MNSDNENSTSANQANAPAWKRIYRTCDAWSAQHRRQFWLFCIGGAAYDVIVGAFAWFYCHSSHPVYPDPRATFTVIGAVAVSVLFFILWPLVCFRFKKT